MIVSRVEWGAQHPDGSGPAPIPAEFLYLHHSATSRRTTIRSLENIGQSRFGAGVSYTFVVRDDGTVYEGHSIDRRGTHTRGLNSRARAICVIGNYQTDEPTERALDAIVNLTVHGHRQGWWPNQITGGHRNAPGAQTACPGDCLYARIPDLNRLITARLTNPPPSEGGDPLMPAALDDNDARRCLIRQWFMDYLGRGFHSLDEQAIHLWVFASKGADICLAGILDSAEAQQYRARTPDTR